jgi:hypothetical protein
MVSDVSVMASMLLGICMMRQNTMAGSMGLNQVAHIMEDRRRKDRGSVQGQDTPFQGHPTHTSSN